MSPIILLSLFLLPMISKASTPPLQLSLHLHSHSPPLSSQTQQQHPLLPLSVSSLLRATILKNLTHSHSHPNPNTSPSLSPLLPPLLRWLLPLPLPRLPSPSLPLPLRHRQPPLLAPLLPLLPLPSLPPFPSSPSPLPLYFPNSSFSSRLVGCRNPSCYWIHPSHSCPYNTTLCSPYLLVYGSGSTGGLLVLDKLNLPGQTLPNFMFGCSLFSDRQPPAGLAGFGRGSPSVPSQLGLTRFAYCLVSRKFDDDSAVSGSIFLGGSADVPLASKDLQFIPFVQNPTKSLPFSVYYYVALRKITVGGKKVQLQTKALYPGHAGDGGSIIDSGTTFTYMEPTPFHSLVDTFTQVIGGRYNRSALIESRTGLKPCFSLPTKTSQLELPQLVFHFKGGAAMKLPVENYFVVADAGAVCLAIVTDGAARHGASGPSIIIGSFQQQNYYMLYDLAGERLGFRQQNCVRH
ncbi:Eukaryotic aspartyl protease family protein [Rhynchospora pubera]|uniref:Eukaryotic aspartyl protease family protein n=1 Tax=Rhynchospora pubera TaxID=906938 RepID=A0AAV8EK10_9POAL|nr:Eukaryotic aspartyl protease family protein [Rhynchospora pubera]